ncbi:hypothetical protein C0Q70_20775 [Pomacea canaliculata]|uniref:HEPN domain-containing protein n=1 Tax=Pomacea canaliculata TaxID=400727 RepID=A0A2T7NGI6_POMCA|nr:hypothetical protein C0Q70_20775 [Pomacea canaliculata]
MDDSFEDSEGEELELIRPGLIHELRNVLAEYPDDGQILKEMIQNAEDAGASSVKILADHRVFHRDVDAKIIKKHPHLKFFQGPALCVYNNEQFTENDWKGIRMLHTSLKEKDPLKVGRFGLGFKSVFHLTVFLSGSPQSLDTVFHSQSGFSGTLFWFPLRRQKSDLSDTRYTEDSLKDLLQAFKTEASSTLIFLKNLERIELFIRDDEGTKPVFTVQLSKECMNTVRDDRSAFKTSIRAAVEDLPMAPVCCRSEIEVMMSDLDPSSQSQHQERWLVVNYHAGREQASHQLLKLCGDPNLCYQPYVGVAMPLGGQQSFQSHLFCFLPLPLETKSPTGLPVHVNGFFALSQNRRHIKWPTADQLRNGAHMEPALTWNCLLVKELLPLAYLALLYRLKEIYNKNPDEFYKAWPDVTAVDDRWQPLARTLLQRLSQEAFFHTLVPTDTWIPLSQAVLQNFPSPVEPDVERAVIHIYTINRESVVRLPRHVMSGLEQFYLLTAAQSVTPNHVSSLVLTHHQQLNDTDKLLLLQYLCSHGNDLQLLLDRPLLPLQDGTFGVFRRSGAEIFWCEEQIQSLFPGLENVMCSSRVPVTVNNHLRRLFLLKIVDTTSDDVPRLMAMSIQRRFGPSSVRLSSHDDWIRQVWTFLQRTAPWNTDLSALCHLDILPSVEGSQVALLPLKGNYVSLSSPRVAELNTHMVNSLSKLGITVVSLPPYVSGHKQILGGLVQYPTTNGILAALEELSKNLLAREKGESDFNSSSSEEERKSIRMFITNAKHLDPQRVSVLTGLTLFTEMGSRRLVSVREVNTIGPRDAPPVGPPRSLLEYDESSRSAALTIGASEVTLNNIAEEILRCMYRGEYRDSDRKLFMKYFLNHSQLMSNQKLTTMAREVQFLPTSSGTLHKAEDLYDCEKPVLRELFLEENLFPCEEFAQSKFISQLKKLGLRDETSIKDDDLTSAAQRIQDLLAQGDRVTAGRKAEGLWTLLLSQGHLFTNLGRLAKIQCIPCLQHHQKPSDYPTSLPLQSTPAIVSPCEMALYTDLVYCGSVRAVMRSGMSKDVAEKLMVVRELTSQDVLSHLLNVVRCYNTKESPHYKLILHRVFERLNRWRSESSVCQFLKENDCVFVESVGHFVRPTQFWIHKRDEDIDLTPYRFPVTTEMSNVCDLFQRCGSSEYQDDQLLQEVLNEIKAKHESGPVSKTDYTKDMRLVKQILDILRQSESARSGEVLVPISHEQQDVLQFRCAKDCTIWTESSSTVFALESNEDEEIVFVHSEISRETALQLGVLQMKDRALTGIEDLDFGYGQHEELTDRLHSLLKDSYTDGFSVPKELIQNADDAGATEVKFLLDERENMDARTNLINEQMASLQGPALWAFNNAMFSDEDFQNIVRLGAGTKTDDGTKVGKFGLGFNSVYNLTDAPSFISRHTMAIFDPQVKYLKGSGLKLDFTKPINRALIVRMPEQFKPFQGVFGCSLHREQKVQYDGTLFRFPLRTHDQALESKIKKEAYSESKRQEFLKLLMERAGNLLTFTQHVEKLEIYYQSSKSKNPADATCLLTLNRSSSRRIFAPLCSEVKESVVQFTAKHWPETKDLRVNEDIILEMKITNEAKDHFGMSPIQCQTKWRISWASGVNESANLADKYKRKKYIPLAAVAILLRDGHITSLSESPFGFYKSGHVFCFLPLPEETVRLVMPVHVNGTFALTSSRRGLLAKTEDDVSNVQGDEWNRALFADPVCRAYILLLESLHEEAMADENFQQYFQLWPRAEGEPSLMRHFYSHLVNKENKLLPAPRTNSWVCFRDARFMDPDLKASDVGEIAWDALNYFWNEKGSLLVQVSVDVFQQMVAAGQEESLRERTITQFAFYKDFFFPNIGDSNYWTSENRDKLVMHALMNVDSKIVELVRHSCCIPCVSSNELKSPKDLIHPDGNAAKLFLDSDCRFPRNSKNFSPDSKRDVNFCSNECLARLVTLGMMKDDLPWDLVMERAHSIGSLISTDSDKALRRTSFLINYLAHREGLSLRIDNCPKDVLSSLSTISFLPILRKPKDWPFPWEGDNTDRMLASPVELFSDSLKELVACKVKLVDLKPLGSDLSYLKMKVFLSLGMTVEKDKPSKQLLNIIIGQLAVITEEYKRNPEINKEEILHICESIYKYLRDCINEPDETMQQMLCDSLSDKEFIWVGSGFVSPSKVALRNKYKCESFLFELPSVFSHYDKLFKAVGVKDEFDIQDILLVLQGIYKQNAESSISEQLISVVTQLAELLYDVVQKTGHGHLQNDADVYLPDRQGYMQHASCLCVDDCDWIKESGTMKFVHGRISSEVAQVLGVKTKRMRDVHEIFSSIGIPFGQHEELTTRITRLLDGFTCDSSIFYELVQNADDSGATEIKIIKDFRSLNTERVPLGWESLQGPALCVYNNKSFTAEDIKGIQSLGVGSKREDMLKTGKYGVGFNVVYHITDVPSFWTREDDKDEVVCVFDPNCQYIDSATPNNAGTMITKVNRLRENYPDMFAGYLENCIDMKQSGTLFRLPLRHEEMAKKSQIKKNSVIEQSNVVSLIEQFKTQMSICLLFLNSIRTIGIYTVSDNGDLHQEYEVKMTVDNISNTEIVHFQDQVSQTAKDIQNKTSDVKSIQPFEVVLKATIGDSKGLSEEYIIVSKAGFTGTVTVSSELETEWQKEHFRILPRGGVAVKLKSKHHKVNSPRGGVAVKLESKHPKTYSQKHLAFCFLPLPVETKLPVHVNGNFALDHETRRGLWTKNGEVKTEWNTLLALHVIVPAYIRAIEAVKELCFQDRKSEQRKRERLLNFYHNLFPNPIEAPSDFWKMFVTFIYRQLGEKELPLFPVVQPDSTSIDWVAAVRKDGFSGYFSNLEATFRTMFPFTFSVSTEYDIAQKKSHKLTTLLKDMNMKILFAPFKIHQYFVNSGVKEVKEVTPDNVICFLKSARDHREDGCHVTDLPQHVGATPFKTLKNIVLLLTYVSEANDFLCCLEGLPLCLLQSQSVHFFEKLEKEKLPFVSAFLNLLPGSPERFVHESIMKFLPITEKTQDLMRDLDIPSLTLMLPGTFAEEQYKAGCSWTCKTHSVRNKNWFANFWDFIATQIKKDDKMTDSEFRKKADAALESLAPWTLIPVVRKTNGATTQTMLYPVKDSHLVVHVSSSHNQSHPKMCHMLSKLPLPLLDMECLRDNNQQILVDVVASVSHPYALMHALTSPLGTMPVNIDDACEVLRYFSDRLHVLQEYCADKGSICTKLKKLPFFITVNGEVVPLAQDGVEFTVLSLSEDVPSAGLGEWSRVQRKVLLKRSCVPNEIAQFLCLLQPSSTEFYAKFFLPAVDALPRSDILEHMTYIRNRLDYINESEKDQLVGQLKVTAFLEKDGRLYRASEFFSPHEPVFRELCDRSSLPPEPYDGYEWYTLMKEAGMVCEVSSVNFLEFARKVEMDGRQGISSVEKRSKVLVTHLFHRKDLKQERILHDVKNIRFVLPLSVDALQEGTCMKIIAEPPNANRLVSFSESCQLQHVHLIWSSSVILSPNADPVSLTYRHKHHKYILQELQFHEIAPVEKVMEHTRNVCSALAGQKGPEIFATLSQKKDGLLAKIMMDIYEFLNKNAREKDINLLKSLPIICDIENEKMMRPEVVVLDLRPEETIDGEIEKAPTMFGPFFGFFQKLDVSATVTANHYAKVLMNVAQPLDEMKLLPTAHQMKWISNIVREVVPDNLKSRAYESEQAKRVQNKINNPAAVAAILWLAYDKHMKENSQTFTKQSKEHITQCLTHITVKEVENLHTVLYHKDAIIEDSRKERATFTEKTDSKHRKYTTYLDAKVCRDMERNDQEICRALFFAVQFVLNTELDSYYLMEVLKDPVQALKLFEDEGLPACDFLNGQDYSAFPKAGSFIPVEDHCFLDNSFHQYTVGEIVGFEMYDPVIKKDGEADLGACNDEANPVYVYAIVQGIEGGSEQSKLFPFTRKYRIYLGPEKGEEVVSVMQIYKFVRKENITKSLDEFLGPTETDQEKTVPSDMKAVLREIRETLIVAWQLEDEADRRRIVKRLFLTWHPDKNRDNEDFCTRVMQMLNHYVHRLTRGESISPDEDEEHKENFDSSFYGTDFFNFFSFMNKRAAQHRDYYQSRRSAPAPNKQPGEGRRWFRQAQADLRFALTTRESFQQGHNWICYNCHQAVEKALKAVLFSEDADKVPAYSHDIGSLAFLTNDSEIIGWTMEIESIVGVHTRMRYPDSLTYPKIPDDFYSDEQAGQVCGLASSVVDKVERLLSK